MVTKLKNIVPKKILRLPLTKEEVEKMVYALLPFGFVKGRIGQWRVRWQNGKPIVYKKADVYNASRTPASVNNRNNMGAAFRLAAALNKGSLKEIWTTANAEGSNSYTRLIKHFRKTLKGNVPSIYNSIVPSGHQFIINDLVTFNSERTIKINRDHYSDDSLVIVLVPFEPIKSGLNEFEVINICVSSSSDSEIQLTDEQTDICRNYKKYILYSVLIRRSNNVITWSNTAAVEGKFCISESLIADQCTIIFIEVRSQSPEVRSQRPEVRSQRPEVRSQGAEVRKAKKKAHAPPGRAAA